MLSETISTALEDVYRPSAIMLSETIKAKSEEKKIRADSGWQQRMEICYDVKRTISIREGLSEPMIMLCLSGGTILPESQPMVQR